MTSTGPDSSMRVHRPAATSSGAGAMGRWRESRLGVCVPQHASRDPSRARVAWRPRAGERAREARMDGMGAMTSARHTSTISTRDAFAVSCGNDGTAMV